MSQLYTPAEYAAFCSSDAVQAPLPSDTPTRAFWTHGETGCNPLARGGCDDPLPDAVDVCIIGSGITGVSCAYHLSELARKEGFLMRVAILEARDFCSGATGRNGGHLTANIFGRMHDLAEQHGAEQARRVPKLEAYTVSKIVKLIHEHGWERDVDFVEGGRVELIFSDAEKAECDLDMVAARRIGVPVNEQVTLLNAVDTEKTYGAKYDAYSFAGYNLWPLKLMTKIYQLAKNGPAKGSSFMQSWMPSMFGPSDPFSLALYTHTPVLAVTPSNNLHLVTTNRGALKAKYVVHATNAYASHLLPELAGTKGIIPTRGQVIAIPSPLPREQLWNCSFTGNEGFEYWFARPSDPKTNPLIILGGGREGSGPRFEIDVADDSITNEMAGATLRRFLSGTFPGKFKDDVEPAMEWTGIMGFTATHDPFVGLLSGKEREYVAAGYSGHGMPRAFSCAEVIAQMIVASEKKDDWNPPEWFPEWYLTLESTLRRTASATP